MRILNKLFEISLIKTAFINFRLLPLSEAIKFPIYIYRGVKLYKYSNGKIIFKAPVTPGLLKIGKHNVGTVDCRYSRSILENSGTIIINGNAQIGAGSKISVMEGGVLELGSDFSITGQSQIICGKHIKFGNRCLMSWDILVMDTDFHKITEKSGNKILNPPAPIIIGDHVWIGCRTTILKGVEIADNAIIAAGATITRSITDKNVIYGGSGKDAGIIRRDVEWKL